MNYYILIGTYVFVIVSRETIQYVLDFIWKTMLTPIKFYFFCVPYVIMK